jgi:hypothetical protein
MSTCDVCGNDYDKSFTVSQGGRSGTFDSFECAIHAFAEKGAKWGCRGVGKGAEKDGVFYCCAHCAAASGVAGVSDRA